MTERRERRDRRERRERPGWFARWRRAGRPAAPLRLRLRTKLVVAMAFAALVPVLGVALLATGVILSSLEGGLRVGAERQLGVGLNLVLRNVQRLGDEAVQLAETSELAASMDHPEKLAAWFSAQSPHVPSSRLQLLDAAGQVVFDRVVGGADARFRAIGLAAGDRAVAHGLAWGRSVALVAIGDTVVVRAVSPIVDPGLALRGVIVLSTPLDGEFADGIKGALSADVLLGGSSGVVETTFHGGPAGRAQPVVIAPADRDAALRGEHVIRSLDVGDASYTIALTALRDRASHAVGLVGVAVDRGPLAATKRLAVRSLIYGGLAALGFALTLALLWSRRLGAPIAKLHRGAIAVSRGDLDHRIEIPGGDELTDLASAFNQMTSTLQDNQARLAARMREIVALHDAGRAVSSVIDMASVSRKIVEAVARTFDVQLVALWLAERTGAQLRASAARSRRADISSAFATDEALSAAEALRAIAEHVRVERRPLRLAAAADDPAFGEVARAAGAPGPLVALPLDRKTRMVGVIAVARGEGTAAFSEAELSLLTTFADQAGAAVDNALLYAEVREASEELEKKVRLRTTELTAINYELGKALAELGDAQSQLVLSERMAGVGLLVAGVAHEINSPTAAIRGSIDGLAGALTRVARHSAELAARSAPPTVASAIEVLAPALAERALPTGVAARKAARELAVALEELRDPPLPRPAELAAELADLGATPFEALALMAAVGPVRALAPAVTAALTDHVYLQRTASTVRQSVASIQRIVGALKSYSHLDQQAVRTLADVHEGLETTLALLHYALRDTVVERLFGTLPRIPVFVDELNQVWTNLIQNAQQALAGRPPGEGRITITTAVDAGWVVVRVTDNGSGVPAAVLPRIFEPFFTTKAKGEGTGLGLGIARQIVLKHGGSLRCESEQARPHGDPAGSAPGRTTFEVRLPIMSQGT